MSLHEKTSWYNLIVLVLAVLFYFILFAYTDIGISPDIGSALFISADLLIIT